MTRDRLEEQAALVALLRARPGGMPWAEIMGQVLESGSARAIWSRLADDALLPDPLHADAVTAARADVGSWLEAGIGVHTVLDPEYPRPLLAVHQAPPVLFSRGEVRTVERAVSVVGSRRASDDGLWMADGVARALVKEGITVLSGLAAGIDTAAHRAALDAGGRTVAVIGTGIRRYYPAENRALQDEIARRGLVLSQFWPDSPPGKHTFPMRNATMSGYGLATVVVQAGETSGARIQARVAVEHGRPVILGGMVVDRNEWARNLIGRPGVHRADDVGDVLAVVRELVDRRAAALRAVRTVLAG
jgi:DNA processing protein